MEPSKETTKLESKVEFKGEDKPEEATEIKVTEHMDTKTPINEIETPEKQFLKEIEKTTSDNRRKKIIKMTIIFGGIALFVILVGILGIIFKLDSYIFPSTVFGTFKDFSARPLDSVQVCIQSKCVFTDNEGSYSITGLKYGKYDITAEKDRYYKFIETIDIQRGKNEVNREMQPFGFGEISGKLKSTSDLNATELKLMLDDVEVPLDSQNGFLIRDKMIGTYRLKLSSPFYQDFDIPFELKEGLRDFGEIVLIDTRDIQFQIKDWINNQAIEAAEVKIGEKAVKTNAEGVAIFADLPLTNKYEYKIAKDAYRNIEESLSITDTSKIIDPVAIRFVRIGRLVYTSNRSGNYNIYTSDYDGGNEKMISDNRGNNFNPVQTFDGKSVFFLSTRDNYVGAYGELIPVAYRVNMDGTGLIKITENKYEDYGSIGYYNFIAGKRAYTKYSHEGPISQQDLYFGNISGSQTNKIFSLTDDEGYIGNMMISPNGQSIVAIYNDYSGPSPVSRIVHINPTNGVKRDLYIVPPYFYPTLLGFSNDSNSILALASAEGDLNLNVFKISINVNNVTKITNNSNVELNAFFTPDGKKVLYYDNRDAKVNIFSRESNGSNEVQLTEVGKVDAVTQITNNLVAYVEQNQLMIVDMNFPKVAQKVTSNVSIYKGAQWND